MNAPLPVRRRRCARARSCTLHSFTLHPSRLHARPCPSPSTASASPAASPSAARTCSPTPGSRSSTTTSPPTEVAQEMARFDNAIATARNELAALVRAHPGQRPARVRGFSQPASDDPGRQHAVRGAQGDHRARSAPTPSGRSRSRPRRCSASSTASRTTYLRERKADVVQVVERVLKALTGQPRTIPAPLPSGGGQRPGGARPLARRRDPVQAAPLRQLRHRPRRGHLAHRDPGAQPQHPLDRRAPSRAPADPRERAADRGRHQRRGDRQPRRQRPDRSTSCARSSGSSSARSSSASRPRAPRRSTARASSCTPTSSCPRTWRRPRTTRLPASACSAASSCS